MLPLSVSGSASAFDDGTPLPARSCGPPVTLATGLQRLAVAPGLLAVDDLRLSSPAPQPVAVAAATGSVTDPGTAGRGSYDHVRVTVSAPSWLVLGEGYNRGWRASCNGRALGAPTPIDGYANGWRVRPGCTRRELHLRPQPPRAGRLRDLGGDGGRSASCSSAWAGGAGGVWVQMGLRRPTTAHTPVPSESPAPRPAVRALAAGRCRCAFVFGFVFGVIPGIVSVPVIALVLWRGIDARRLTIAASRRLLGIVVPVLYLVHPGERAAVATTSATPWATSAPTTSRWPRSGY